MTEQVTDQQRRKVAARLREAAPVKAAAGIYERIDLTCACWLSAREPREARECAAKLADLIDRPACRIEGVDRWTPAASIEEFADVRFDCGHSVTVSPEDMPNVRYCPVCGAEVAPDA